MPRNFINRFYYRSAKTICRSSFAFLERMATKLRFHGRRTSTLTFVGITAVSFLVFIQLFVSPVPIIKWLIPFDFCGGCVIGHNPFATPYDIPCDDPNLRFVGRWSLENGCFRSHRGGDHIYITFTKSSIISVDMQSSKGRG